ncbi:probable peptidoglycan muropeptide transporter SLC46 [Diabrotica undecimpunctata]|uniref:probable peptidoglycan muropeptide transporter SLC46 n=1 Tax=Diabrotica undecimpunctata TaxID=50387 RepID=UPI003B640030
MLSKWGLTIEIPLLLTYFTFFMDAGIILNLNLYLTCYTLKEYPEQNCSRLGRYKDNATKHLEELVQPEAAYVTTITEMVPAALPVFVSLMIGSWSDKHGRKPVMVYVLTCLSISCGVGAILINFCKNPYLLMLGAIPAMACGGGMTFFSVTLAYINEISTPSNISIRMAIFEVISVFSTCFGTLASIPLLYATSYSTVYVISCSLIFSSAVYTYFLVSEPLKNISDEKRSFSNVFTCDNFKEIFMVPFKRRPHNKRSLILLLLLITVLLNMVMSGEKTVQTLYLMKVFKWTSQEVNVFSSWSCVVFVIGTVVFTFLLNKKLHIKESYLTVVGIVSLIVSSILYGIAKNNWFIYLSVPVTILRSLINPMLRTLLGKNIAREEMGKIFSLIYVLNTFLQLGGGLMYNNIYQHTQSHPEAFNWVSIGLYAFCILLVIVVIVLESGIPEETSQTETSEVTVKEKAQVTEKIK